MTAPKVVADGGENLLALSLGDILTKAEAQAEQAPSILQRSVRLYYFTRFVFSLYESSFKEVPGQALNEYRNALDHFMRFAPSLNTELLVDDSHHNLHKMDGHLQRAALDVCKTYIYRELQRIDEFEQKHNNAILVMVTDGKFLEEFQRQKQEAKKSFEHAKIADLNLGEDFPKNDEILNNYITATQRHIDLHSFLEDNKANIGTAQINYEYIQQKSGNLSTIKSIAITLVTGLLFFLLGLYL